VLNFEEREPIVDGIGRKTMRFATLVNFGGVSLNCEIERDGRSLGQPVGLGNWRTEGIRILAGFVSLFFLLRCACAEVVFQQVYTTSLSPPLYGPFLGLTEGSDGNFYGMRYESQFSQTNFVLFRVSPGGNSTKIMTLSSGGSSSALNNALVLAKDGNFYGTTPYGGTFQQGSIFRCNGSAVSVIYSFDGVSAGTPKFSLVEASDGLLYGVTTHPAAIFSATTDGVVTVLTNFPSYNFPIDGLAEGPDSWLYGATHFSTGGGGVGPPPGHEIGRVFKFSPTGGFKTLQYVVGDDFNDDARPQASPVKGNDGFLYGPMGPDSYGTTNQGSIYRMTTNGATTNMFTFSLTNGLTPSSRLLLASDGNFYGICALGGAFLRGTIFRMSSNGMVTVLVQLNGTNGTLGMSYLNTDSDVPLIEARNGILYGTMSCQLPPTSSTAQRVFRLVEPPVVQCDSRLGKPTIIWNSFSGGVYQISYKTAIDATGWTILNSSLTATGLVSSYSDDAAGTEQRFYRVTLLP